MYRERPNGCTRYETNRNPAEYKETFVAQAEKNERHLLTA